MAKRKKKATTKGGKRKWMQEASRRMEEKGTKGAFREYCRRRGYSGVTQACIEEGKRSKDPTIRKRAVLAETFKRYGGRKRKKKRR
jgi:hypothetical protein